MYSIHSIGQFHIGVFYSFYWTVSYRCILFILLDSHLLYIYIYIIDKVGEGYI